MLDKLKADFDGILELVQKVPDPLKETALTRLCGFRDVDGCRTAADVSDFRPGRPILRDREARWLDGGTDLEHVQMRARTTSTSTLSVKCTTRLPAQPRTTLAGALSGTVAIDRAGRRRFTARSAPPGTAPTQTRRPPAP